MLHTNALLVVAKRPAPGRTKTRLTPPLSPEQAAALYECFLRDTLDLVRRLPDVAPAIAYLPAEERAISKPWRLTSNCCFKRATPLTR